MNRTVSVKFIVPTSRYPTSKPLYNIIIVFGYRIRDIFSPLRFHWIIIRFLRRLFFPGRSMVAAYNIPTPVRTRGAQTIPRRSEREVIYLEYIDYCLGECAGPNRR